MVIRCLGAILWLLNNHCKLTGASPSTTAQGTVTNCPAFKGRSPKVNGKIFGGTVGKIIFISE